MPNLKDKNNFFVIQRLNFFIQQPFVMPNLKDKNNFFVIQRTKILVTHTFYPADII